MHKDFPCSSIYYIGKLEKSFYIKNRMVQKKRSSLVKLCYKHTMEHHITIKKDTIDLYFLMYANISIYPQYIIKLKQIKN